MTDTLKLFFFDTETTGTDPKVDRIIQFWWIWWEYDYEKNSFNETRRINQYVNVTKKIPEEVTKITWIENKDLEKYWYIQSYIEEFILLLKNATYVIWHNVEFDKNMIIEEAKRCNIPFNSSSIRWIDTMKPTTDLVKIPDGKWWYKRPKLKELYNFLFKREFYWAHNAMSDILATKDCFCELCKTTTVFDNIIPSKNKIITEFVAKDFINWKIEESDLEKCKWITLEWASTLCKYKWDRLLLNWLESIDYKTALALGKFKWDIIALCWIKYIDKLTASSLATFNVNSLYLKWLEYIDVDIARELSKFKWKDLRLNWFNLKLNSEIASQFIENYEWKIHLYGFRSLSDYALTVERAQGLASNIGNGLLSLGWNNNAYIGVKVMRELVKYKWDSLFLSIKHVDEELAREIIKFKWKGHLSLDLISIDEKSAQIIAKFWWDTLQLKYLKYMNKWIAKALSSFKWDSLYLDWFTGYTEYWYDCSSEIIWELVKFNWRHLNLCWLTRINVETAKLLASFWWESINLLNIEKISLEEAEALSQFWWTWLGLRHLNDIDKDTAKALSNFNGDINASDEVEKKIRRCKRKFRFF